MFEVKRVLSEEIRKREDMLQKAAGVLREKQPLMVKVCCFGVLLMVEC